MKTEIYLYLTNPIDYATGKDPYYSGFTDETDVRGWVYVGKAEVEHSIDDIIERCHSILDAAEEKTRAEANEKLQQLKATRSQMMALEHSE